MLDKGLRKNIKNKRNDGKFVKYKLNEMGALNRRGETNQIKVKGHQSYSPVVLKHGRSLERYLELWRGKKIMPGHFFFLIQDDSDMHWVLKSDYNFFY